MKSLIAAGVLCIIKMGSGAAVFVLGPAGSGKSTLCQHLLQLCSAINRPAHLFNLDPAADTEPDPLPSSNPDRQNLKFSPSKNIKELITVDEVMEDLGLGPNGGLVYALETLLEHREWLDDDLSCYEDEFLVIDCPGQIELYSCHDVFHRIIGIFQQHGYRPCVLYLLESQFLQEPSKFFAGVLQAASAMLQLAVPHVNIISKMDLVSSQNDSAESEGQETAFDDICEEYHPLHSYFFPDPKILFEKLSENTPVRFKALNEALVQLVDEFDVVNFIPLDVRSEECLQRIMLLIENATQYSENLEPKEPKDVDPLQDGDEEALDAVDGSDLNEID